MMINKGIELATEAIPGCVLQLYVWITNPEEAGSLALLSIAVSALTTGYTSSMIMLDLDVDVMRRKKQPQFYGLIPDDHGLRGRCFMLMILISALHNINRSIGCVLLFMLSGRLSLYSVIGECSIFMLVKVIRGDQYVGKRAKRAGLRPPENENEEQSDEYYCYAEERSEIAKKEKKKKLSDPRRANDGNEERT